MTGPTPVDHCRYRWYGRAYAAAEAGIPPDLHTCAAWRADHPGQHRCCCGATKDRQEQT